jgi:transcriptional regulator with XRE-family HTH domain
MLGRMRQHHDPERIESLLARRERRGMTWFQLAAESGVPATTLQWWQRRLRQPKERRRRKRASFVPVAITESPPSLPAVALEVELRTGARIRVPAGFDPDHLRRVVEALESGC